MPNRDKYSRNNGLSQALDALKIDCTPASSDAGTSTLALIQHSSGQFVSQISNQTLEYSADLARVMTFASSAGAETYLAGCDIRLLNRLKIWNESLLVVSHDDRGPA